MKKISYILMIAIFAGVFSCKKSDYLFQENWKKVSFIFPKYVDSVLNKTFVYDAPEIIKDTLYLQVRTMGQVVDKDTRIKLEQIQEEGEYNAIPGVHYIAFDDKDMVDKIIVKADSSICQIPIVVLRDASLKEKAVLLKIRIVENEHFIPGPGKESVKCIYISDRLSKPSNWDLFKSYYGTYGEVKHQFMIDITNLPMNDETFVMLKADRFYAIYIGAVCKKALLKYNEEHSEPLREKPKPGQKEGDLVDFTK